MTTTPYYDHILATMPPGVEHQVLAVLRSHIGSDNRISLNQLTKLVTGKVTLTTTRHVRLAIETLRRDYGIAVLSESGRPGRWLAATEDERQECLREFKSRLSHLEAVVQALSRARIPPPSETQLVQPPLF